MTPFAASASRSRLLGRARFGVLAALGVLFAHDAIYAAHAALAPVADGAAHDYWPLFVGLVLLAGLATAGGAVAGVVRLRRLLRGLPATPARVSAAAQAGRTYAAEVGHLWPRLFVAVTVAFLAQENLEHLRAGLAAPGLFVLSGPAYPVTIPVIAAVTGLLAAAGAWLRWHTAVLEGRIAAAHAAARHPFAAASAPAPRWAMVGAVVAHGRTRLRPDAGRAPPATAGA